MLKRIYATVDSAVVLENRTTIRKLQSQGSLASLDFEPKPGMLYTRVRAISARVNRNFDGFTSHELKRAYKTFLGRPVFVNHSNYDPTRTRGIILDSEYHENGADKYISLLLETDANAYPKLAKEIIDGNLDSVSMGCDVEMSVCSFCNNIARAPEEFCEHILYHKGQILERPRANGTIEQVLVYEECRGLNFFEISYVFDPADETALMQEVFLPRAASVKTPESFAKGVMNEYNRLRGVETYNDTVAPEPVDTLRKDEICPQCGDDSFDGVSCTWCKYTTPPEQLQDPDVEKAKQVDLRQEDNEDQEQGEEEENVTTARKPSLSNALAKRRLAMAQQRLADLSVNEQPQEGAEQIADTPAPEPGVSTEQVREEPSLDAVQDLDETVEDEVDLAADERVDVTVLENGPDTSIPSTASRRRRPQHRADVSDLTEGGDEGQGADGEGFEGSDAEVAQPDARVDVEAPVSNTTDDYAQDSQYDPSEYDENQGSRVKDPDESTDQNWVPRASSMAAMMLVDAYIEHGLTTTAQKFAKFAEFEKLPAKLVEDRLSLLAAVKAAQPETPVRPRGAVPRGASTVRRPVPSLGQPPRPSTRTAGHDSSDTLLFA